MLGDTLKIIEDEDGASLVEYSILVGLCSAAVVAIIAESREVLTDIWGLVKMRWDDHDLAAAHPGLGSNR